jgi:glycosyltransferase involved in cell wall biosynthesis
MHYNLNLQGGWFERRNNIMTRVDQQTVTPTTTNKTETVLCSISTRGRYDTTLPLAIQSVINQTKKVDKLIIFDDNDESKAVDLRELQHYQYLFDIMNYKGIEWAVIYGQRKGQHYNHQIANTMGYDWVWRVDDDCMPDTNVLETLFSHTGPSVGAVGGSILTPPFAPVHNATGLIENISDEPNIQWDYIQNVTRVDHLHCSFLYRAGVYDYNLALSRVAHREETLFTYGLKCKGYDILVVPDAVTWHLKNKQGGIRTEQYEMFAHDEDIYNNYMSFKDKTIVVLDSGMGDHIVFKHMMHEIKNPEIFTCYPDIVPGRSIAEAYQLFENLDSFSIYKKMDEWKWKDSLENAFRRLYVGRTK